MKEKKAAALYILWYWDTLPLPAPTIHHLPAPPPAPPSQPLTTPPSNTFSFYFSKLPVQKSALIFGAPDPSLYWGNLTWIPVARQFYWEIRITDILVDGKPMGMCDGDLAAPTGDGCKVKEGRSGILQSPPSLPRSLPRP